jgi:hypothetical protein
MNVGTFSDLESVRIQIQHCSDKGHVQQVAYSTYHDGLTQVCFSCGWVRTCIDVSLSDAGVPGSVE